MGISTQMYAAWYLMLSHGLPGKTLNYFMRHRCQLKMTSKPLRSQDARAHVFKLVTTRSPRVCQKSRGRALLGCSLGIVSGYSNGRSTPRESAESRTPPETSPDSIHSRPPDSTALGCAARVSARRPTACPQQHTTDERDKTVPGELRPTRRPVPTPLERGERGRAETVLGGCAARCQRSS